MRTCALYVVGRRIAIGESGGWRTPRWPLQSNLGGKAGRPLMAGISIWPAWAVWPLSPRTFLRGSQPDYLCRGADALPFPRCRSVRWYLSTGPKTGPKEWHHETGFAYASGNRRSRRNARSRRRGPRAAARRSVETRAAPHRRMDAARDRHPHDNSAGRGRIQETTRSQALSTSYRGQGIDCARSGGQYWHRSRCPRIWARQSGSRRRTTGTTDPLRSAGLLRSRHPVAPKDVKAAKKQEQFRY